MSTDNHAPHGAQRGRKPMERIRAEMGNPRFTGKGAVIEGVLTLKFLVDCSDVSELAMIEDLSALAEKTVIVTLEPIQQEMRFEKPKQRKTADDGEREPELIPKTWEVRVNPVAIETAPAQVGQFWSFIAQEALAEIPAACLLSPFLPGSDGNQLVSMRVTTPERDMIVGYLATRAFEAAGDIHPILLTFVGDTAEAGEGADPWLAVGKQVLVPMELGPEWANAADHGGMVLATVLEIRTTADGATETVEVEFRGAEDGQVEMRILTAEEAAGLREPLTAPEWPSVGMWARIPEDIANDAMDGMVIADGFACGEILTLSDDGLATVRVVLADGEIQDLSFAVADLLAPEVEDEEPWPVVGSWVRIPGDVAWDADAAVKVVNGFADGEVRTIEPADAEVRTATVCVNLLSGVEAVLTFPVEVFVNPLAASKAVEPPPCEHRVGDMECEAPRDIALACKSRQPDATCSPAVVGEDTYPETPVPDHEARAATLGVCLARMPDGKCIGANPCESKQSDGMCGSDDARGEEPKAKGRGRKATQPELKAA